MTTFSCSQCRWTVAVPMCPGCNQFLTDDMNIIDGYLSDPVAPDGPIKWATAFGHWGDVFVCCGVILAIMKRTGQRKCNVLYVGPDLSIAEWLREQGFVRDVHAIKITTADVYPRFWEITARTGTHPADWLPILSEVDQGLPDACDVTQTHINMSWFHSQRAQLWRCGRLPQHARDWASKAMLDVPRSAEAKVIHLHPVSTWSEQTKNHWPYWMWAIDYLLTTTPHTYVLTGQQRLEGLDAHPQLFDMIGKTPGNMDVLALSEACDGVISTPNNVAIWSVIQGQKALVVGNKATQFLTSYYARFLVRGERMTYRNVDVSFDDWVSAADQWLEDLNRA